MATHIQKPTIIPAAGNKPKIIQEYIGHVNSGTTEVSIARMHSPSGWVEPGQTPDFTEYTLVLKGALQVETREGVYQVKAGEAIITPAGEWVRFSTPGADGAEYVAICVPAFTPDAAHRDPEAS